MSPRADDRLPARHVFVAGSTGSGKTLWVRRHIKSRIRLLWDPDGSHDAGRCDHPGAFAKSLEAQINGGLPVNLALCVAPTVHNFQWFCSVAWEVRDARRPMTVVLEEVGHVANAVKAEGPHHELLTRGRKYGVQVVSICQRPQEIDKTTIGNASTFVCGYLDRRADRDRMAAEMDLDAEDIAGLLALRSAAHLTVYRRDAGKPARRERLAFRG